jgi:hypothetical protein
VGNSVLYLVRNCTDHLGILIAWFQTTEGPLYLQIPSLRPSSYCFGYR